MNLFSKNLLCLVLYDFYQVKYCNMIVPLVMIIHINVTDHQLGILVTNDKCFVVSMWRNIVK